MLAWTTSALHGPPSGSRLRPAAGWWRTGGLLAWTTTTLHGPPSGSRLRLAAGWWCTGGLLAWTTSTLHWPPSGSRLRPAAAWWFTGLSHLAADLLLAAGLELVRHLPSRKLYCIRATAWQQALAGCWRLRLHFCDASGYLPGCLPSPPNPHWGAHHQPSSGRSHKHLRLRQDPPPLRVEGVLAPS